MDYKEAWKWITKHQRLFTFSCSDVDESSATAKALEALEKQIPKKPLFIDGRFECPFCHNNWRALNQYCDMCGQALDWREFE